MIEEKSLFRRNGAFISEFLEYSGTTSRWDKVLTWILRRIRIRKILASKKKVYLTIVGFIRCGNAISSRYSIRIWVLFVFSKSSFLLYSEVQTEGLPFRRGIIPYRPLIPRWPCDTTSPLRYLLSLILRTLLIVFLPSTWEKLRAHSQIEIKFAR